jgi:hypothetical protein
MKTKLLIAIASLVVCGANVALAQHEKTLAAKAFLCSEETCSDNPHCTALGCTGCTEFPVGFRCYLQ